jgi:hypothetical protein
MKREKRGLIFKPMKKQTTIEDKVLKTEAQLAL